MGRRPGAGAATTLSPDMVEVFPAGRSWRRRRAAVSGRTRNMTAP
jgi:hypothetical protein